MLNSSPALPSGWQVMEPQWTDLPCHLFFSKKWAPGLAKEHSPQCFCPEPAHLQPRCSPAPVTSGWHSQAASVSMWVSKQDQVIKRR